MRRALLAGTMLAAGAAAAAAQSGVEPIAISEAKDHAGCYIYVKTNGSRLLFQGKPVTPRGNCPGDFLRGNVERFGGQSYRLRIPSKQADCIMTAQGVGRCQPGVIDDRPNASPPPLQPQPTTPPSHPVPPGQSPPPGQLVPQTAPLPNPGGSL
jgi:hypothetical protein